MTIHRAERTIRIAAPPEVVFQTITDYPSFPEWQDAVVRVDVHEENGDGLGELVELFVDAKLRQVRYRLRYRYERPGRIWWEFVEADGIAHIEGEYLFEADGDGTVATYRVGIDPGVPVPGLIARRANATVMKRSVEDLRAEAERRARG